jgi:hypothetical protein
VDQLDSSQLSIIAGITASVDASVADKIKRHTQNASGVDLTNLTSQLRSKVTKACRKLSKGLLERETEVGFNGG